MIGPGILPDGFSVSPHQLPPQNSVPNGTALLLGLWHVIGMRGLNLKQLTAVPCPSCGVAPGKRCLSHSGFPRSEPHVDRKLSVIRDQAKPQYYKLKP